MFGRIAGGFVGLREQKRWPLLRPALMIPNHRTFIITTSKLTNKHTELEDIQGGRYYTPRKKHENTENMGFKR